MHQPTQTAVPSFTWHSSPGPHCCNQNTTAAKHKQQVEEKEVTSYKNYRNNNGLFISINYNTTTDGFFFFSLARILGKCSTIHSPPFFKWRQARAHQFHFLGQDHSTVAQRAETTVAECSTTTCSFSTATLDKIQSAHSDFDGTREYACLGVTCHLHFLQNDRGLLRALG